MKNTLIPILFATGLIAALSVLTSCGTAAATASGTPSDELPKTYTFTSATANYSFRYPESWVVDVSNSKLVYSTTAFDQIVSGYYPSVNASVLPGLLKLAGEQGYATANFTLGANTGVIVAKPVSNLTYEFDYYIHKGTVLYHFDYSNRNNSHEMGDKIVATVQIP